MKMVNTLFTKSLSLEKRYRFKKSSDGCFSFYEDLIGKSIYKIIVQKANKKIYKQILYKIMKT